MKRRFADIAFFAAICLPVYGQSSYAVEVERVEQPSAAERAGIRPGDQIERWSFVGNIKGALGTAPGSRGLFESSGEIQSPFDLELVEAEKAPIGKVKLAGNRQGRPTEWVLDSEEWGLLVRPPIPARYLADYEEANSAKNLLALAEKVRNEDKTFSVWLCIKAGDRWYGEHNYDEAMHAYTRGLNLLPGMSNVLLLLHLADQAYRAPGSENLSKAWAAGLKAKQALATIAPESLTMARCLRRVGICEGVRRKFRTEREYFQQALTMAERLAPNGNETVRCLNFLAINARDQGLLSEAESLLQRASSILQQGKTQSTLYIEVLLERSKVALGSRELLLAEKLALDGLSLSQARVPAISDVLWSDFYYTAGTAELFMDKLDLAEQHLSQADDINLRLKNYTFTGYDLTSLAEVSRHRGDLDRAEDLLQQARVRLTHSAGGMIWNSFIAGLVAMDRGDFLLAKRQLNRALYGFQHQPDLILGTFVLVNLAEIAEREHSYGEARNLIRQAMRAEERFRPQGALMADLWAHLGNLDMAEHHWAAAESDLQQAWAICRSVAPGTQEEANGLHSMALIAQHFGRISEAVEYYERAIRLLETQTDLLGGGEDAKALYASRHVEFYTDYIDLLKTMHQPERAFAVLERSRARSFLRMLAERELTLPNEIPESLRERQASNARAYEKVQAEWTRVQSPETDEALSLAKQMRELEAERSRIQDEIKKASPRLAAFRSPVSLSADEAIASLDPGTVLLSYSVGPKHTTLFVLPAGGKLVDFTLPVGAKELREAVVAFRTQIEEHAAAEDLRPRAAALYRDLVGPADALIAASSRVLIVPDGPLHKLPFAALMRDKQFLVEWKSLHTAVSATVFAQIKAGRAATQALPATLVGFGDPQFPKETDGLAKTAPYVRGPHFEPLPFSRVELETIAQGFTGTTTLLMGAEGTEERAKTLKEAKYIHFATHGIIDERFPLNSALVLSAPDHAAAGHDDGLLSAWEIIEDVRWNTDLVVLSACRSALGTELAGEGLIGLTRAIQFAGAQSVLASLWSVDDRRTAELMESFYAHLKDHSKDEALRAAQVDLLHKPNVSPFYWAPFTLYGDWQ